MGNEVILIALAAAVVFAVRSIIRTKKSGRAIQCGGDCSRCAGGCGRAVMK